MWRRRLLVVAVVLAVLFVPVPSPAEGGGTLGDLSPGTGDPPPAVSGADSITWISTQGSWGGTGGGELLAVESDTGAVVWAHDRYNHYYDVDPLNESHLLVSAGGVWTGQWAIEIDWREDRVVRKVRIPWDTHDVDALPSGDWVVADKADSRVLEIDPDTGEVGWTYRFDAHYDRESNGVAGDFTHLNDVDAIRNGSAYLLSPRNFDRVLVVNRSTRETEWVLGAQGEHAVLDRQHNPTLLTNRSAGGPTVLVADSENHRVVEYRRDDGTGEWRATWTYAGNLSWPRDADRLPNGNTLIVDSGGQRVLEVTPNGSVVWERDQRLHPYDAERQSFGDEPGGPTLTGGTVAPPGEANGDDSFALLAWVPPRPTLAVLLLLGWFGVELRRADSRLCSVLGRE